VGIAFGTPRTVPTHQGSVHRTSHYSVLLLLLTSTHPSVVSYGTLW